MDNFRLILFLSLGAVLFLIYQAWLDDYGRPGIADVPVSESPSGPIIGEDTPASTPTLPEDAPTAPSIATPGTLEGQTSSTADTIRVSTDVIEAEISTRGGTVESLRLLDYAVEADQPEIALRLLKPAPPNMFIVQSGLLGPEESGLPTHTALFTAAQSSFELADGEDTLVVELSWSDGGGLDVVKRYRLQRGSYLIQAEQEITNATDAALAVPAATHAPDDPNKSSFIHTYTGAVYYGPRSSTRRRPSTRSPSAAGHPGHRTAGSR
jgi:YidC/Oxa1 family membrane protein insertase